MLANIINFALLPKAKRSHLLTVLRGRLQRMATFLSLASGPDTVFLARGLASARIVRSQRRTLPEIKNGTGVDPKYGDVGTAIGATAAVLAVVGTLVSRDNVSWMKERSVLLSAIVRAEIQMVDWSSRVAWDAETRSALDAERRAATRAATAVEMAVLLAQEQKLSDMENMRLQLAAAERAAFAPYNLSEKTQEAVLLKIKNRELIASSVQAMEMQPVVASWAVPVSPSYVPLAALPAPGHPRILDSSSESGSMPSSASSSWDELSQSESSMVEMT